LSTLRVTESLFFEGAPQQPGQSKRAGEAPSPTYVAAFLGTTDGLALTKPFTALRDAKLRRFIVDLVEEIADGGER
jgi:hypothetical protein